MYLKIFYKVFVLSLVVLFKTSCTFNSYSNYSDDEVCNNIIIKMGITGTNNFTYFFTDEKSKSFYFWHKEALNRWGENYKNRCLSK